jgi:hypothetical protein
MGFLNRALLLVPSALPGLPASPAIVLVTQLVPIIGVFIINIFYSANNDLPKVVTVAGWDFW